MISFVVHGLPAPQGSKRHVGNGVMVESSKKVKPWREAVKFACLEAMQTAQAVDGPVGARIAFYFPRPKSIKKVVAWPQTRSSGDIDKLLRCTFDAIVDAGLIRDDAQIVYITATKNFGFPARAEIEISTPRSP